MYHPNFAAEGDGASRTEEGAETVFFQLRETGLSGAFSKETLDTTALGVRASLALTVRTDGEEGRIVDGMPTSPSHSLRPSLCHVD